MPEEFLRVLLEVLYRDSRLIVVNKPANMAVHRGYARDTITVADILRDEMVHAPVFAVHRLDRATSGALVFALDSECAAFIQQQYADKQVHKKYIALVRGPMREAVTVDHAIPKAKDAERVPAMTAFEPIEHVDRWSLISAVPITGRWHQIRHHLKHISHPIVGDVRYGKGDINRFFRTTYDLNRMALHSAVMQFNHPNGENIRVVAPVPEDLLKPLRLLGLKSDLTGNNL